MGITLAAKCAPEEEILTAIESAGIEAVELYLSKSILKNIEKVKRVCRRFNFRYALHAPNDDYNPDLLAELIEELSVEVVVFHDIFWDDEWKEQINRLKGLGAILAVENIKSVNDSFKFIRRYGMSSCLDIEHLQFELGGIFKEEVIKVMGTSAHIHLTGYYPGSDMWHTHIHHSADYNRDILKMITESGFSGLIVSEARLSLQNYNEFRRLKEYFDHVMKDVND